MRGSYTSNKFDNFHIDTKGNRSFNADQIHFFDILETIFLANNADHNADLYPSFLVLNDTVSLVTFLVLFNNEAIIQSGYGVLNKIRVSCLLYFTLSIIMVTHMYVQGVH